MLPMTWPLLKMLWAIDQHAMPKLRALVAAHGNTKKVFHIRTLGDLQTFYLQAKRHSTTV
jgi:hypothetical protein